MKFTAAIVVTAILSCAAPATAQFRVVDGDTIVLDNQRIRLFGIDAPERSQTCEGRNGDTYMCGQDSTQVLVELTNNHTVTCVEHDHDRYKRSVAICSTEAGELNVAMVRRGWAVDVPKYSHGAYRSEEAAAKAEGLGIWSGRFTLPADYRHNNKRSGNSSGYNNRHRTSHGGYYPVVRSVTRSVMRSYNYNYHPHRSRGHRY